MDDPISPVRGASVADPAGADRAAAGEVPERYLAIHLGTSRLAAGIVDGDGAVVVRDRVAVPARHVWPTLVRLVRRVVAADPDKVRPRGCGVAVIGPVDHDAGVMTPVHRSGWDGFPVKAELEQVLGLPVTIDSAGRALALAEQWCGAATQLDDVVAILLGDVVDAGIISGGKLLGGRTGNIGQIGHLVVEPGGRDCVCGGQGCLDAYVSSEAIQADTGRPLARTPVAIVERTGIMLARGVASLAAMVDTTHVLVSGSVASSFGQPMFDVIARELEQRSRLSHLAGLAVTPSSIEGGPLVAAAAVARRAALVTADR